MKKRAHKRKGVHITSVKSYKQEMGAEKQKMVDYSKHMKSNVKALQTKFKKFSEDAKESGKKLREAGIKEMSEKVQKFQGKIKDQIKENKGALSHMASNVKYFQTEIDKMKRDFHHYIKEDFQNYINAFWG